MSYPREGLSLEGWIIVFILCFLGWGINLVKFANSDFEAPYKSEVIRGVGVFIPPVGIVAGYLHIEGDVEGDKDE